MRDTRWWLWLVLMLGAVVGCSAESSTLPTPPLITRISPPVAGLTPAAQSAEPVSTIHLQTIADGFDRPVYLTHANDDRLFVVEQKGVIWIVRQGARQPAPFLDLHNIVGANANEQGLLGLAFHPEYTANGYFFVYYTDQQGDSVLARYQVSAAPDLADSDSGLILARIAQPFPNHNGGQLVFGPDGYLYWGLGDGGSAGDPRRNAQNTRSLLGKILRLAVGGNDNYAAPDDNPFATGENGRAEIWAWGLRNPWRFSFDRVTGDLYVGDVGQNAWEEIDFQPGGAPGGVNFGWNVVEGLECYTASSCNLAAYTPPVIVYGHDGRACSVTGGYVYRGRQHRSLDGNYFYADYCSGVIWAVTPPVWQPRQVWQSAINPSSFGEDAAGELYVLDHSGGVVYRLIP